MNVVVFLEVDVTTVPTFGGSKICKSCTCNTNEHAVECPCSPYMQPILVMAPGTNVKSRVNDQQYTQEVLHSCRISLLKDAKVCNGCSC